MVSKLLLVPAVIAFTSVWAQDAPTCYAAGNADNAACGPFINAFCDLVSKGSFPGGSKGTACYMANQHKCDFTAYNSGTTASPPSPANCKAVLNAALTRCNTGGRGKYSSNLPFIFAIDPNDGNCSTGF